MQNNLQIEERDLLDGEPLLGSIRGVNREIKNAYGGTAGLSQSSKILKDLNNLKNSSNVLKSLNDRSL